MKTKPTKAQVEARVHEILRIRLDGAEVIDVREYVREQEQEEGSHWKLLGFGEHQRRARVSRLRSWCVRRLRRRVT